MDVPTHIRTFNNVIHRQAVCLKFRVIFFNFQTKLAQSIAKAFYNERKSTFMLF